jgi:tetratricopeptide (TPR) repeat protein
LLLASPLAHSPAYADELGEEILEIARAWAVAMYRTPEGEARAEALERAAQQAATLSARFPERADPRVWEGIVLSSLAGARGGLGALGIVKKAREQLEAAERLDPEALDGSIYTSLGTLYFKVPGWPLSFGNDDKARAYLRKALSLNPDGIDPNFFYGEFLVEQKEYAEARRFLEQALDAPPRGERPLADKGRRGEIRALLERLE